MNNNTAISLQEAATKFVSDILGNLNAAATQVAGVDVMWFRLQPDKRSQDVIFQSYTLFGVEDCPLSFKAIYADSGYDDAAITYNIMGINFAIPMTLDIAAETWKTATGDDGTIPQKGDIVYIPMSRKLLEVTSMQPVKTLAAQLTAYKVNLAIYTPTRSRIVGEQLQEAIDKNTTNLMEKFGNELIENIVDVVDDKQSSMYSSTSKDKYKEVTPTLQSENSIKLDVKNIIAYDLIVDGHTVSRSHYDMNIPSDIVVKYNTGDTFTKEDTRCLSCWVNINELTNTTTKNIKGGITVSVEDNLTFLNITAGKGFEIGENVVLKRGLMTIPGVVYDRKKILVNTVLIKKMNRMYPTWKSMPGFVLYHDNVVGLIDSDIFNVKIKGGSMISISTSDNETLIQMTEEIKCGKWYGVIVNMNDKFRVDLFTSVDGKMSNISSVTNIENNIYNEVEVQEYYLSSSKSKLTNIRLYNTENTDIDKQLIDLLSYNIRNDGKAIINDSADIYLNKEYMGRQR